MRRMWAAGAAILVCLALGGLPALAQSDAVRVTVTVKCDFSTSTCSYTASDPRVEGTASISLSGAVRVGVNSVVSWVDATLEGPEGDWTGHDYFFEDGAGASNVLTMLVGEGAYEGFAFIGSGDVSGTASEVTLDGVVYQGDLPPVGPLLSAAGE